MKDELWFAMVLEGLQSWLICTGSYYFPDVVLRAKYFLLLHLERMRPAEAEQLAQSPAALGSRAGSKSCTRKHDSDHSVPAGFSHMAVTWRETPGRPLARRHGEGEMGRARSITDGRGAGRDGPDWGELRRVRKERLGAGRPGCPSEHADTGEPDT